MNSEPITALDPIDLLPDLPDDEWHSGDGYDWIQELRGSGWRVIQAWGAEGWDLGSWPYQIIAHCDRPDAGVYGVVTYTEGDTHVEAFGSREARDATTNQIAVNCWINNENGPDDLTEDMSLIPAQYCGPYRR